MASLKSELKVTLSENTDFSDKEWSTNWDDYSITPTKAANDLVIATTGGITYDTGLFTTIEFLAVLNTDSTNFVTATFRTAGNGGTDNIIRIPAGGQLVVTDFTPGNDLQLTADTANVTCKLAIAGTT